MSRFFFDTSALVKHYHAEAGTAAVDRIIGEPPAELFIARVTLVETISVFAIKGSYLGTEKIVRLAELLGKRDNDALRPADVG